MADADQVTTHYVWEVTRGVTPASPALKRLRTTSPELTMTPTHFESEELNAHRETVDYTLTGLDVGGTIGLEMPYGNADEFVEAGFCGTWARKANATISACSISAFTVGATATSFKKGMVVRVAGMATAGNNGLFVLAADGSGTTVGVSGLTAEASAPGGATMTCVGFQGASGDMQAVTSGGNGLTITSSSGDFTALGLAVGEWVLVGGALTANRFTTDPDNNGRARIGAITATKLTLDIVPTGWGADNGSSKTIRLTFGDRLVNGKVRRSATVQNRVNDASPVIYTNTRGQEVATLSFDFSPRTAIKASMTLMGDDGDYAGAISGQTDVAAVTTDIMNTGADMGRVAMDGAVSGANGDDFVRSLSIQIDNRMRNREALGRRGYAGRGLGRLAVTGNAEIYLGNTTALAKAILNTDFQADLWAADAAGRTIMIDIPAFKFGANVRVGGSGQDVMVTGDIKARRHPTLGYTLLMQRFPEIL